MGNTKELPKRKSTRLAAYDYSRPGAYFVTVCTAGRRCILWDAEAGVLSPAGKIVESAICDISLHYPCFSVDKYVVMPNHIHMLLTIRPDADGRMISAPTLSVMVGQMKRWASRQAGCSLWQKSFHEHVVRGETDYREIWRYIDDNPAAWAQDRYYEA